MKSEYTPLFSHDECTSIQSRLMAGMNKGRNEGINAKEAYEHEGEIIAKEYGLTRDELLSELAKSRSFHADGGRKKPKKSEQDKHSFTGRYSQWCQKNDYVSSDAEIAFWANCAPQSIGYARQKLVESGFAFEKNGHGYVVKAPEIQKMYTQQEVALILEGYKNEILSKFGRA